MTNPMFNPQPNYSGVTIQIANPAVYAGQFDGKAIPPCVNGGYCGVNQNSVPVQQGGYINYPQGAYNTAYTDENLAKEGVTNPIQNTGYPNSYPAQYYLNNYNYGVNGDGSSINNDRKYGNTRDYTPATEEGSKNQKLYDDGQANSQNNDSNVNSYKLYAQNPEQKNNDMSKSQNIIGDLAEREAEIQEEKKNTKETKIVALTDEYIKSLENYLNNPNDEIRLMASKEILTRLDEDKDRYDDAALNALLNKMMQDPNKLVRIAALSAFGSQLASGNDYTVKLLHNIQSNPNADKEDVLQAADILLKMSAGVEVKNIPNPSVKDKKEQ